MSDFPAVAEWLRRQRLDVARKGQDRLQDCILALREGRHVYSISPDGYVTDNQLSTPGGAALTWACGVLRCDEYFYVHDSREALVLRRFGRPEGVEANGFPAEPAYPTVAHYHYRQDEGRVTWGLISDQDPDDVTWRLWHHALAGFKIEFTAMDDVVRRLEAEAVLQGWDRAEIESRKAQGFACFLSGCHGVLAVLVHAGSGLSEPLGFADGKPFRLP